MELPLVRRGVQHMQRPAPGCGVVFKLHFRRQGDSFCTASVTPRPIIAPMGTSLTSAWSLTRGGNLYGTTPYGGAHVTRASYSGSPQQSKYKVLHSFCALNNCKDGMNPQGALLLDQKGNLVWDDPVLAER